MKQLLFLLALSVSVSAFAQNVPQTQNSLIIKKTATWCPPCGGWGWTLFENLIADNEPAALLWAMHYSGDLQNPTSTGINSNLTSNSQPRFFFNNTLIDGNADAIRTAIKDSVNQKMAMNPVAQAAVIDMNADNSQISVTAKVKFFQQAAGEYFLNVYIIENGVINQQAGQGPDAMHEKVLRSDMAGDAFGVMIASGTLNAGEEFTKFFTTPVATNWDVNHIELHTVLWKKNGNHFDFVNGTDRLLVLSNHEASLLPAATLEVRPNPVSGQAQVKLIAPQPVEGTLELYDWGGRKLRSLAQKLYPGAPVNVDFSGFARGPYLLKFVSAKGIVIRRVLVTGN